MQVIVKKSVLFSALKKILNENRTGHSFYSDGSFLGRFEEEEETKAKSKSTIDKKKKASSARNKKNITMT